MTTLEVDQTDSEWLPNARSCPSWCDKTHAEALAEGNGWERSQVHHVTAGGDVLSGLTSHDGRHVREWGGSWDLTIEQHPAGPDGGFRGPALIGADFAPPGKPGCVTLNLTSGEARTLAAQLIAAADRIDGV